MKNQPKPKQPSTLSQLSAGFQNPKTLIFESTLTLLLTVALNAGYIHIFKPQSKNMSLVVCSFMAYTLIRIAKMFMTPRKPLAPVRKVKLGPWSPLWAQDFREEKERVEAALKPQFKNIFADSVGIQHVGSTSVKNIRLSTSTIDALIKLNCENDLPKEFYDKMKELGYTLRAGPSPHGNDGNDKWFQRKIVNAKTGHGDGFNLHVILKGAHDYADQTVGFSEYLNRFENERKNYEDVKQKIIDSGIVEQTEYKKAKIHVVMEIKARMNEWRNSDRK